MSDFSVTLPADILRAVAIACSAEETRYYLQGVSVEPDGPTAHLVATDGHRLMVARVEAVIPGEKFIIPADAIARALKGYKAPVIELARRGGAWQLGDTLFRPIDGSFPAWNRVMPDLTSKGELGKLAQFDSSYLESFRKAAAMLGGRASHPHLHHCGASPALVTFSGRDDIFGLCMPRRGDDAREAPDLRLLVDMMTQKASEGAIRTAERHARLASASIAAE
jgi:hypothetical protein